MGLMGVGAPRQLSADAGCDYLYRARRNVSRGFEARQSVKPQPPEFIRGTLRRSLPAVAWFTRRGGRAGRPPIRIIPTSIFYLLAPEYFPSPPRLPTRNERMSESVFWKLMVLQCAST